MKRTLTLFVCFLPAIIIAQLSISAQQLDKNNVRALINKTNDRFWVVSGGMSTGSPAYEVPKGSGKHAQFVNSLWVGGFDNNNQLHLCANTYKQSGTDYWPGPLDTNNIAIFISTVTAKFNRVWKIDCNDINAFAAAYSAGSVAANSYTVPEPIRNYPANGYGNQMKTMEAYKDANGNGVYNPVLEGDYPIIKGHQQILSIFNDNQFAHTESGALPMRLEIHEKSYVFYEPNIHDSMKVINYTTFNEYTIYNRSSNNYHDVYVTDWADVDIGGYLDDYIGTDTANQFVYAYNADNDDQNNLGVNGYGLHPPVASHALLSDCPSCLTDGIDNDHDGTIDEPGEKFTMDKTTYFFNNSSSAGTYPSQTLLPTNKWDYYKYMSGRWRDSTEFKYGFYGYSPASTLASNWVFTGNPQTGVGWTESSWPGNPPDDRRHLLSCGPFNLPAKKSFVFSYAIVFSQDTVNAVNTISEFNTRVVKDVEHVRYYEKTHRSPQCLPVITPPPSYAGLSERDQELNVMVYPNPATGLLNVDLNQNAAGAEINLSDLSGRVLKKEMVKTGYRCQLDLAELSPGVYFLEVSYGDKKTFAKVIRN